jgi:dihydropteroate synthase
MAAKKKNSSRVIFDPCFGFSKNTDQNWYLWEHLEDLLTEVDHHSWLIGISRKRFLHDRSIDELGQKRMILEKDRRLSAQINLFWRVHALRNYNSF